MGNNILPKFRKISKLVDLFCNKQSQYIESLISKMEEEGLFSECKWRTNLFPLWEDIRYLFLDSDVCLLPIAQNYQFGNLSL